MAEPDPRMKKVLTAFNLMPRWPDMQRQGIRNLRDLNRLNDQQLAALCRLPPASQAKLRQVLVKVVAAQQQPRPAAAGSRQSAAGSNASSFNPFASGGEAGPPLPARKRPAPPPPGGAGTQHHQPALPRRGSANISQAGSSQGLRGKAPAPPPGQAAGTAKANRILDFGVSEVAPPTSSHQSRPAPGPPLPARNQQAVAAKPTSHMPHKKRKGKHDEPEPMPYVVHKGWATKCGGKVKSWNYRYFILRSDGTLTYAKDGSLHEAKGTIDLNLATEVHGPGQCHWTNEDNVPEEAVPNFRFEILTPERTFKIYCKDQQSAQTWADHLEKVRLRLKHVRPTTVTEAEIESGAGYQRMLRVLEAINI